MRCTFVVEYVGGRTPDVYTVLIYACMYIIYRLFANSLCEDYNVCGMHESCTFLRVLYMQKGLGLQIKVG